MRRFEDEDAKATVAASMARNPALETLRELSIGDFELQDYASVGE